MNQDKPRLFLALIPPDNVKNQIIEFREKIILNDKNSKIVDKEKLHITLFFLGQVDDKYISEIKDNIKKVIFKKFSLKLDHTGYFSNSRAFWLGCNNIPEKLLFLVKNIYKNLENINDLKLDFNVNLKSIYIPHVTLFKHVTLGDITTPVNYSLGINWDIENFYLVRSKHINNVVEYELVGSFG